MSCFFLCLDIIVLSQDAVIWCSRLVWSLEDPYVDIQTPNIMYACLGDSLSIYFSHSWNESVSVASLSTSRHFPSGTNLKSIQYYFVFSALTCHTVALVAPAKILRPFCDISTVSSRRVSGEGAICMIVESSTKQYPTIWEKSCEMLHLNTALCTAYMKQLTWGGVNNRQ